MRVCWCSLVVDACSKCPLHSPVLLWQARVFQCGLTSLLHSMFFRFCSAPQSQRSQTWEHWAWAEETELKVLSIFQCSSCVFEKEEVKTHRKISVAFSCSHNDVLKVRRQKKGRANNTEQKKERQTRCEVNWSVLNSRIYCCCCLLPVIQRNSAAVYQNMVFFQKNTQFVSSRTVVLTIDSRKEDHTFSLICVCLCLNQAENSRRQTDRIL